MLSLGACPAADAAINFARTLNKIKHKCGALGFYQSAKLKLSKILTFFNIVNVHQSLRYSMEDMRSLLGREVSDGEYTQFDFQTSKACNASGKMNLWNAGPFQEMPSTKVQNLLCYFTMI